MQHESTSARWFADGREIASIATEDRSWQYGDGLFETIAVRDGAARLLDWHIERMQTGCRRLGIAAIAGERLYDSVADTLRQTRSQAAFATLKLVVTAGASPRGYRRPPAVEPGVFVGLFRAEPLPPACYRDGVAVRRLATRLAEQPALAGIKSLNRLEQVLARREWDAEEIFEGLTLDTSGRLICGTMSNVFLVDGDRLLTPDLSRAGVNGIMRRKVLETLSEIGSNVDVVDIDAGTVDRCTEMFLTNSQYGVVPVAELDGRRLQPGPTSRSLMRILAAAEFPELAP